MASVNDLIQEISEQVGDTELERVDKSQLLVMLNASARDLVGYGIVIGLTDNESLSAGSGTLIVVPAGFVYIHDLWGGASFQTWIPHSHWSFRIVSSAPNILFDSELQSVTSGSVRIVGHARPSNAYSLGSGTIDVGMEGFLRVRATAYAAKQLAQISEGAAAANLEGIGGAAMQESLELLQALGAQAHFRPNKYSRAVPLR